MKNPIEIITEKHEKLYNIFLNNFSELMNNRKKLDSFIKDANELIKNIEDTSSEVNSIEDYIKLNRIANQWRVIYSTNLNIPRNIEISPPKHKLESNQKTLSENDIHSFFSRIAFDLSEVRKWMKIGLKMKNVLSSIITSTLKEQENDWYNASVYFAAQVLNGDIDFALKLNINSYFHLQAVWLDQIKRLEAYFNWENRNNVIDNGVEEYYQACDHIQNLLTISASKAYFSEVKSYLEQNYLTDGRININKKYANDLITIKAKHLSEKLYHTDDLFNWLFAERYVKMFYENIIPAVIDDNYESTLLVLKAFQYCIYPNDNFPIIDAFEVALAIYFLNEKIVKEIWNKSEGEKINTPPFINFVDIEFDINFDIPHKYRNKLKIDYFSNKIIFEGVMLDKEHDELIKIFNNQKQIYLIDQLYDLSRIVTKKTTL